MTDILELETRKNIYEAVEQNPGIHLSAIAKVLNMSAQLVDYHLSHLEYHGFISIEKEGGLRRCYIKGAIGTQDKRLLGILRQRIPLQIVLFLLKHPYSRHRDILRHLDMSSPRFSYHLRKLVSNMIIEATEFEEQKGYVVINEKNVMDFLIRYKPTGALKMVKDTWEDFGPG